MAFDDGEKYLKVWGSRKPCVSVYVVSGLFPRCSQTYPLGNGM